MKVLVVADGPRDEAAVPPLLKGVLDTTVECEFEPWARIHKMGSGQGYDKKLRFSVAQARSRGLDGVVAVVDQDKDSAGGRAKGLRATRQADREQGKCLPTALGIANPHVDVWLLDDPAAVREGLGLDSRTEVMSAHRTKNPKAEVDRLIDGSRFTDVCDALRAIAARVQPIRCNHASTTGFGSFIEDCRREFASQPS